MIKKGFVFAAIFAAVSAFGQVDNNRVVATINGEDLKGAEFYRRMEFLPDVGKIAGNEIITSTPAFWVLERIITERMILALAKEKGVSPTQTEIDAEINLRLESNPKMFEEWTASGQPKSDLEFQIKVQIAQFKIATMGITVTDQEIDKFYKDYPSMFTIPKRYKLRVISVSDDAKKAQVDFQLQSGKSFAEVAKAMSEDVTKADGGYYGTIQEDRLSEVMRKALANVKVGGATAWLEAPNQKIKIYIDEILAPQLTPMDAGLRRSLRRKLMLDRGKTKNDVGKMMADIRKRTKIDIKSKDLAAEYERVMRKFDPDKSGNP